MFTKKLLIVNGVDGRHSNDRPVQDSLQAYLSGEGFFCLAAKDAAGALTVLDENQVHLLLLDMPLPDVNGFDLLRRLRTRQATAALPIIMLSDKTDEIDRVVGLEMGADDYVTKPFSARELLARIRALFRRAYPKMKSGAENSVLTLGNITLHRQGQFAVIDGKNVRLTHQEMTLLFLLADNPGRVMARDTLCRELFGHIVQSNSRTLDMTISRLRKKLGPNANGESCIRSARGEGYSLLVDGGQ